MGLHIQSGSMNYRGRKYLRKGTALLAALAIFLQVNTILVFTALYSLNEQGIAGSVCENIAPHCNGQCYLKKQIQASQDEGSQKNATQGEHSQRVQQISFEYLRSEASPNLEASSSRHLYVEPIEVLQTGTSPDIFNPPKA